MGGKRVIRGDLKNKKKVVKSNQPFNSASSLLSVTVLVVDDDCTSLSIVSGLLKTWKYQVTTVRTSVDALSTLRVHSNIDLVVTDLHIPGMNGIELQKQIEQEFKLPVVIMSSDDSESMIYKSLASGAAFYLVKPVNPAELKNVWQYAIGSKKGKSIVIEEIPASLSFSPKSIQDQKICNIHVEDMNSSSSEINKEKNGRKDCKRKTPPKKTKEEEEEEQQHTVALKKAKVSWTNSLHNRFLQALRHIGMDRAVPKRILEFMNVPGLTRENVASHLQKYRLFLKRVAERGIASSKALRSSFAVGQASLLLKNPQTEYKKFMDHHQPLRTTSFQPTAGLGRGTTRTATSTVPGLLFPSRQEASSSKSVSQLGYGYGSSPSNLLGGRTDFHIGNTNSLYNQANCSTFGIESNNINNFQRNLSSYGLMNGTSGVMNAANPMYQKQTSQATRPADLYNNVGYNFGCTSSINQPNIGTSNTSTYAGIRINTNGELTGAGQMRPVSGDGFHAAGFGFMNGIHNDNMMTPGNNWSNAFGYNSARQQAAAAAASSAVGFESSANLFQVQPTVTNTVSRQENTNSMLAPQPQELNNGGGVGENDLSSFGLMNINSSDDFDDINIDPLLQMGEGNLDDILFDPNNYEFKFQQQGVGEGVLLNPELPNSSYNVGENQLLNPKLPSSSNNVGENLMINQVLNPQVPDATFPIEENAPWNEQALSQNGTGEEVTNLVVDFEDNYPIFDQNSNEEQSGGPGGNLTDIEFDGMKAMDNIIDSSGDVPSFNQDWDDECFMDSLFNSGPYN